jgi:hypothetical protein
LPIAPVYSPIIDVDVRNEFFHFNMVERKTMQFEPIYCRSFASAVPRAIKDDLVALSM